MSPSLLKIPEFNYDTSKLFFAEKGSTTSSASITIGSLTSGLSSQSNTADTYPMVTTAPQYSNTKYSMPSYVIPLISVLSTLVLVITALAVYYFIKRRNATKKVSKILKAERPEFSPTHDTSISFAADDHIVETAADAPPPYPTLDPLILPADPTDNALPRTTDVDSMCVVYLMNEQGVKRAMKVLRLENEPKFDLAGLEFYENDSNLVMIDKENPGQYIVNINGKLERLKQIEVEDLPLG